MPFVLSAFTLSNGRCEIEIGDQLWTQLPNLIRATVGDTGDVFKHTVNLPAAKARQLAALIEKTLPDLPDDDQMQGRGERSQFNLIEWYSGPGKEVLCEIIDLCRSAPFEVSILYRPGVRVE